MFDILKITGKIGEVQKSIEELHKEFARKTFTGEAGAGLVKVSINGGYEVTSVSIDPQLLQEKEQQTAEDLVVGATNIALKNLREQLQESTRSRIAATLPSIPGLDLSKLF